MDWRASLCIIMEECSELSKKVNSLKHRKRYSVESLVCNKRNYIMYLINAVPAENINRFIRVLSI